MTATATVETKVADPFEPDAEIVDRAHALRGLIREYAAEGEKNGRVSQPVIDKMLEAGLFSLTVPRRYGGAEVNKRTYSDVLTALGQADGSTAWSAMLINIGNWMTTTFPQRAQDEVFGGEEFGRACVILSPTGKGKPTGDGGFRVTGQWPYASGSYISTHALISFLAEQPDGSYRQAIAILQPGQYTIDRTWFPIGLCATGSDTIVAEDVEIPAYRIQYYDEITVDDYTTEFLADEPRARAAFIPAAVQIFGSVLVGMGKAAYELTLERTLSKGVAGTVYKSARNSPTHQIALARASALIDAADLLQQRAARDIDEFSQKGEKMDLYTRGRVRNDVGMTVEFITEAVDLLMKAAGSSSFMADRPLSRIFRDVNTGGSHVHATPGIGQDVFGKIILGSDDPIPAHP